MNLSTLGIQTNPPVAGAWVHISYSQYATIEESGEITGDWDERCTNTDGYAGFMFVEPRIAYILLRARGYEDVRFNVAMPHDDNVTVDLVKSGTIVPSSNGTLSPLTSIVGHRMVTKQGEKVYGRMASAFLLYKKFLDGEDITPFLAQHRDLPLRFNFLRVMGMFESLGGFNPKDYGDRYYTQIRPFMALCESYGFYVYWVACAATGSVFVSDSEVLTHIRRTVDELKQTNGALLSPVNEQGQHNNSINRQRVKNEIDMGWMLHDMGSFGSDLPCEAPFGTHADLHCNRGYPSNVKDGCTADHPNKVQQHLEVWMSEPVRYGDDGNGDWHSDPQFSADAAGTAYTALGWCFHSMQGEKAEVLHGLTFDCAKAACAAMAGH